MPKQMISAYLVYLIKAVIFWFVTAIFITGQYHLGWLLIGVWWGDYQFFKDLVDVHLFMEEE